MKKKTFFGFVLAFGLTGFFAGTLTAGPAAAAPVAATPAVPGTPPAPQPVDIHCPHDKRPCGGEVCCSHHHQCCENHHTHHHYCADHCN